MHFVACEQVMRFQTNICWYLDATFCYHFQQVSTCTPQSAWEPSSRLRHPHPPFPVHSRICVPLLPIPSYHLRSTPFSLSSPPHSPPFTRPPPFRAPPPPHPSSTQWRSGDVDVLLIMRSLLFSLCGISILAALRVLISIGLLTLHTPTPGPPGVRLPPHPTHLTASACITSFLLPSFHAITAHL